MSVDTPNQITPVLADRTSIEKLKFFQIKNNTEVIFNTTHDSSTQKSDEDILYFPPSKKPFVLNLSSGNNKIRKKNFYESNILKLNSNKAKILLKWRCILTFNETMKMVAEWYKNFYFSNKLSNNFTILQIEKYQKLLKRRKRSK